MPLTTKHAITAVAAGLVRKAHTLAGAALVWCGFVYCFWRMGTYLPGVPPATQGIFRMQQVCGCGKVLGGAGLGMDRGRGIAASVQHFVGGGNILHAAVKGAPDIGVQPLWALGCCRHTNPGFRNTGFMSQCAEQHFWLILPFVLHSLLHRL